MCRRNICARDKCRGREAYSLQGKFLKQTSVPSSYRVAKEGMWPSWWPTNLTFLKGSNEVFLTVEFERILKEEEYNVATI